MEVEIVPPAAPPTPHGTHSRRRVATMMFAQGQRLRHRRGWPRAVERAAILRRDRAVESRFQRAQDGQGDCHGVRQP